MLKGLFGKKKDEKEPAKPRAKKLSSAMRSSILNVVGKKSIPSMPGAAQRAFELATDPKADARDYVEVIESDESLSARVVKIANSVFFDRGQKCETIEQAVVVIGLSELRSLLNATTLSEIFPSRSELRTQFWKNDVATALIARLLAGRLLQGKEDAAFLAGLMHDVGKLLLVQRASAEYKKVLALVRQGKTFSEAEEEIFVFNHQEVGQLIAERWNFSPDLIAAIRDHHNPLPEAPSETISMAEIIHCADTIAHSLGFGHPSGFGSLKNSAEEHLTDIWEHIGIEKDGQKEFLNRAKLMVESEYDLYSGKAG